MNDICCGDPDPCCNADNPCCTNTNPCDPVCGDPCLCLNCDDENPCTINACVGGACTSEPKCPTGQNCCANGDCCIAACCGGGCGGCCTSAADCDDGDPCTINACVGGGCTSEPKCLAGQNCCTNGECCPVACDECIDFGTLSGGTITVTNDAVCVGDTITFTASGVVDSGGTKRVNCVEVPIPGVTPTYAWTLTIPGRYPAPLPAPSGSGPVVSVQAKVLGTYSATFTAGAGRDCPPSDMNMGSKSAMAIEIEFAEDSTQAYGFDDYTNRNNSPVVPYKSVEVGGWDDVQLESSAPPGPGGIDLASSNTAIVTVEPASVSVTPAAVTVWGQSLGSAPVNATVNGAGCASIEVSVHDPLLKSLAIVLVHEENDDTQVLAVGQGSPNQHAIRVGTDGTLESVPAGDDGIVVIASESIIHTGGNGICDTPAEATDVQVIPVGQGKPDQLCVGLGNNAFRDTDPIDPNDVQVADGVGTGSDGICNTTANSTDLLSTDIGPAFTVEDYLSNTVYNQVVEVWTVQQLPPLTVNFDLNRDGKFDVISWTTPEMNAVIGAVQNPVLDYYVLLVDRPNDGSGGFARLNQRFAFVHVDSILTPGQNGLPTQVAAHELGHAQGLNHVYETFQPATDTKNLMDPYFSNGSTKWRLRRAQWIQLNP